MKSDKGQATVEYKEKVSFSSVPLLIVPLITAAAMVPLITACRLGQCRR